MSDENNITNSWNDANDENGMTDAGANAGAGRPENASRRKFLKAALIGTAATAAVGAATVVGLEHAGAVPHLGITKLARYPFVGNTTSPGGSTGTACTSGTDPQNYVDQSTFNNKESIFLWALFTKLPAGSYTMFVSPTIENKGGAICSPSPASNPFEYQGSTSSSSNVQVYNLSASAVTWTCHPSKKTDLGTVTRNGASMAAAFSTPVTVAAGHDLQLQVHMHNGCSGARVVSVTISLFQSPSATPFLQASTSITINA
ncbi:MAG: twin-arginine translocation signal domain-containing protein [Ktedonobacterales bacterium]